MAISFPQQANFSRGVLTPKLRARTDLDQFKLSLHDALNFLVLRHGALARRSGSQHIAMSRSNYERATRLLEFIYDNEQAYVIEVDEPLGGGLNGAFRFFTQRAIVEDPGDPGNPLEVAHTFTRIELRALDYAQSFNSIYLATGTSPPKVLTRASETSWSLADYLFQDGPYNALNITGTTLDASGTTGSVTIVASSTDGINGGAGFGANDIGRWIRIAHPDGANLVWGAARITAVTNSTTVTALVKTSRAFHAHDATTVWKLGSWYPGNWPRKVGFYGDRLAWASTAAAPSTIWFTENGILDSFTVSSPQVDTDALTFEISGVPIINWLAELDDLLYGTPLNARAIGPSDRGGGLAATNVEHRKGPPIGAKSIKPVNVGSAVLYANSYGKALREMTYNYDNDAYIAPEASVLSDHLLRAGIDQMTVVREPETTIWMRDGDGKLISMIYDAEQKIVALMPHVITKGSGDNADHAFVSQVAAIPGADGWDLYLLVDRTVNGALQSSIEVIRPAFEDDDDVLDAFFVDAGLEYDGAETSALSGFDHLIGETVSILVDGGYHPQKVVDEDGIISFDFPGSKIVAGLPLPAFVETLEIPLQQDGSLRGRKRKLYQVIIDLLNSGPVDVNQEGLIKERVGLRNTDDDMDEPVPLFTGPEVVKPESAWDKEGRIIVSADPTLPLPAMIRAITPGYDAEP